MTTNDPVSVKTCGPVHYTQECHVLKPVIDYGICSENGSGMAHIKYIYIMYKRNDCWE